VEWWEEVLGVEGAPLQRIAALLDGLCQGHEEARGRHGHAIGCFLGNTASERSTLDPLIREWVDSALMQQQVRLTKVFDEASASGDLREDVTPEQAARDTVAWMQGYVLLAKVQDDPSLESPLTLRRPC
jgi:TetR/AcrR family transcriptional repressor of nem operon